jgi:glycosyltransferase involved in cell wall biosynthesis
MPPAVSVLLPARNAAKTLPACLRSLRRQTFADWECVLVDDGSGDETRAIAERVAAEDARVRVVATAPRGLVPALTAGLAACRGTFVARMDADDLMHRERLARQVAHLRADPTLAGAGTHVRFFPRAGLRDGLRAYETWLNGIDGSARVAADAFVECPLAHPTLMLRRDVLARHGYRDAGWPEDYDLLLRLLTAGERLGVVPRRLHAWRDGPTRLTRTHPAYALERITDCKAAFLADGFLAGGDAYLLWGYGSTGRTLAAALTRLGKRPSHVVELHPGRLGNRIHGALVVPPEALDDLRHIPLVASVAGPVPRRQIRDHLDARGWRERVDYVCAA